MLCWIRHFTTGFISIISRSIGACKQFAAMHSHSHHSLYGKTIENLRKRTSIKLIGSEASLLRHIKKPTYKRHVVFDDDFVGIEKRFKSIELNKPIYVGMSVLDLSKVEMQRFHYLHMLPKYGHERLKMLMTDTDSFVYRVETANIYADMLGDIDLYDTSDYNPNDPLHSNANKKVLGKMKDELPHAFIRSFVGLRSKMYSIETSEKTVVKRAKGVSRNVVAKTLNHADYLAVIFGPCTIDVTQRRISSMRHQIVTREQHRRGLSGADDKRYLLSDNIKTNAHGHFRNPVLRVLDKLVEDVASSIDHHPDVDGEAFNI
jgi:hypothetical protein